MAKESEEQRLMHKWWVRIILAAIFLVLAYGFGSLAVDSGSLWQYAVAVISLYWAIAHFVRGLRTAINR